MTEPYVCPTCHSEGFLESPMPNQCSFCDGTENGDPPSKIDAAIAVRNLINSVSPYGDLYMRLRGFYWMGPKGTDEPEFGYRDFSQSELRQPIHDEAADALKELTIQAIASQGIIRLFTQQEKE